MSIYYSDGNKVKDVEDLNHLNLVQNELFASETLTTINSIMEAAEKPCLVYNIITDTHIRPSDSDNVRRTFESVANIKAVNRKCFSNGVIHLGDVLYDADGMTDTEIYATMQTYIMQLADTNQNTYVINGNHDGKEGVKCCQYEWYSICGRMNASRSVAYGGTNYFYVDYPEINTRCIFLATADNIENDSQTIYGYTPRLLNWLSEIALDTPDDYGVIMFAHYAPFFTIGIGSMVNESDFYGVCNAYHNHTTYSSNVLDNPADFTSKSGTKLVAYICGHAHGDKVMAAGETVDGTDGSGNPVRTTNGLDCAFINIGCALFSPYSYSNYGAVAPARTDKTVTQDLWDTMVYRPDLNKIYMIRFGAGNDREIDVTN